MKLGVIVVVFTFFGGVACKSPKEGVGESKPPEKNISDLSQLWHEEWDGSPFETVTVDEAVGLFLGRTRNYHLKYNHLFFFSFSEESSSKEFAFPAGPITLGKFFDLLCQVTGASRMGDDRFTLLREGKTFDTEIELSEDISKSLRAENLILDLNESTVEEVIEYINHCLNGIGYRLSGAPEAAPEEKITLMGTGYPFEVVLWIAGKLLGGDLSIVEKN